MSSIGFSAHASLFFLLAYATSILQPLHAQSVRPSDVDQPLIGFQASLTGGQEAAKELTARALKHAKEAPEPVRHLLFAEIATSQSAVGDEAGSLATLARLPADNSYRGLALMDIAVAKASKGHFDSAFKALQGIKDSGSQELAARRVALLQEGAGDTPGAARTMEMIKRPRGKLLALLEIADAQTSKGNKAAARRTLAQASDIASRITDDYSRAESWVGVGKGRAKIGDRQETEAVFNQARKAAKALTDPDRRLCRIPSRPRPNRSRLHRGRVGDDARPA